MDTGAVRPTAVVDRDVFDQLAAETTPRAALAFGRVFMELLPHRVAALDLAIDAHHEDNTLIVLLSVQSGARMLGAHGLATVTGDLLAHLRSSPVSWERLRRFASGHLPAAVTDLLATAGTFHDHGPPEREQDQQDPGTSR